MADNERAFWAEPIELDPSGFTVNDVKLRALRAATGLTESLNTCERQFYADRLEIDPFGYSVNDLELMYYRDLGLEGSTNDCRRQFLAGSMSDIWEWSA